MLSYDTITFNLASAGILLVFSSMGIQSSPLWYAMDAATMCESILIPLRLIGWAARANICRHSTAQKMVNKTVQFFLCNFIFHLSIDYFSCVQRTATRKFPRYVQVNKVKSQSSETMRSPSVGFNRWIACTV